ncbi:Cold-shock domain family protein [Oleispira antarctica RB-8]|uniref:Cold-shock domain family protein n=1 Tax=Oleispira antarctica RB-8 TaxID=698738 RepID=R4YLQ5_OLEAN|nr:Cold-shock domain family protein [Oleispira antarctica RB-8]|tara:strand:+ start:1046 stop:1543 length:498 start_codon:yes stop_codon:yes gene_type:complete
MKGIMIRKILVSLVLALIAPFILKLALNKVLAGIVLASGSTLGESLSTLPNASAGAIYTIVALIFFAIAFAATLAVPARRRRNRSSGTVVESDVDDGRERGMVKWFNVKKGFGFITWDDGEDVFVHFRSIRGQGHRSLTEGQRVKFMVVRGQKGPQAEDVSVVRG